MTDTMNAQATVATNGASSSAVILSAPRDRAVSTPPASVPVGAVEYRPRPGSQADTVIRWFVTNPEEHLSTQDIALKFDVRERSVGLLLSKAVDAGLLTVTKGHTDAGRPCLYYSVGAKAMPLTETIEWHAASVIPEHHGPVLIVTPYGVDTGYHSGCWRNADGIDADVTHWAEMPGVPQ